MSESLARLGAQVTAIDPSAENIDVATGIINKNTSLILIFFLKAHSKLDTSTSNICYKQATIGNEIHIYTSYFNHSLIYLINIYCIHIIEDIVSSGDKFDMVCALEVLEHVHDPTVFISQCCKALRPGGSLFLSTINRTIKSYAITIVAAERIFQLLPSGIRIFLNDIRSIYIYYTTRRNNMIYF